MKFFRIVFKYFIHFFSARHTGGFGVHSPFVFQFVTFVLKEKLPFYSYASIEKLRAELLMDKSELEVTDFGTGVNRYSTIASIARKSVKKTKYAQLLARIANYYKAESILELGTSLGITTSYMAATNSKSRCVTLEGCPEVAKVAQRNFSQLGIQNIEVVVGNADETLKSALIKFEKLDLVFFDANHRKEPLLRYFEACLPKVHGGTIFVVDDIYWSDDMEQAWTCIKQHPSVVATVDLFQMGIVFFNANLYNKHYKMRY